MLDPVSVYRAVTDDAVASNGMSFPIYIHKLLCIAGTNNAGSAKLYNAATVTGNSIAEIYAASALDRDIDYTKPLPVDKLSVDLTGSGCILFVYYTRK